MEHYVIKPAGEAGEAAVHAGLRAYNRTFVSDTADLSLVVEDGAGQIIGGCNAFRMGELALLDVLWVAESRRGTGLGACLLAQLEQDAARQGAKRLELNTFGFQALIFIPDEKVPGLTVQKQSRFRRIFRKQFFTVSA